MGFGATVVITAGALIYIFATVPPRSRAIEEAVREAAGARVTDTVMATVTVAQTFVQPTASVVQITVPVQTSAVIPAPAPTPVPAAPEVVNPGAFCDAFGATGITDSGTQIVCTTAAEDRDRWRSHAIGWYVHTKVDA